ncbi:hemerythrin domain-containing protein, partial [Streptomyces zaomyceticus]|uniref:hemerythrin domain-containing protein n=1 Tax=Streptomyces zaomyceticus TaxID=68286 RepID=UPI00364FA7A5
RATPYGAVDRSGATGVVRGGVARDGVSGEQPAGDRGCAAYPAAPDRIVPVIALHRLDLADPARHRAIADHLVTVHNELRAELTALRAGLESPTPEPGRQLARHCLTFCGALHAHHHNEDSVFDLLERQFPELTDALERMREEHRAVAGTVDELEALLGSGADPETLRAEFDGLATRLEEHFAHEEARLIPALTQSRVAPGS